MVNSKELIGDIFINGIGYNPVYQQCGYFYLIRKLILLKKTNRMNELQNITGA